MRQIKINKFLFTLAHLNFKDTLALSLKRIYSVNHYYILKKNLAQTVESKSRTAVELHRMNSADMREVAESLDDVDGESKRELIARLLFHQAGFKNGYVARTKKNEIAFLQWLVFPSENEIIKKHFSRKFYPLEHTQVMIENAFTFPKFRGLGLLPDITHKLLSIAREKGYSSAVTYIRKDKIASLNEFLRMRFKIVKMVSEYRIIGITIRML